ncbi:MAG: hypothetical protein AB7G44_09440 [Bacteroidia bacterium]
MSLYAFIRSNPFFTVYCLIIVFLFPGVYYKSGFRFFDELALHLVSFAALYFLLKKYFPDFRFLSRPVVTGKIAEVKIYLPVAILIFTIGFVVFHFLHLGFLPLLEAARADNSVDIALIRQNVTQLSSGWVNYLTSFTMRALIPFFLVYSCIAQRRTFFVVWIIIAVFYSLNLMQKNHIVMAFVPLALYFLLNKKYLKSFAVMLIPVTGIYFLVLLSNPGKVTQQDDTVELTTQEKMNKTSIGLFRRLMIVPGKTVGDWFLLIPDEYPYLNGCGYRFAKVFGCEHTEYSKLFYPRLYPRYAEKGLKGTVNVASFMYEYSNFGKAGLFIGALIIVLLFLTVQKLFYDNFLWLIVFNLFPALVLSSQAFTTLLFSGGWGLTILLFFIFRDKLTTEVK